MLTQIKILTKLELRNLYGLNVIRFSTDKKVKHKAVGMTVVWCFVIAMLLFYVGGLCYGLVQLDLAAVIPAYLMTISSMVIFFFGIFKAGSVIFKKNGYDILCSLPLSQGAIVVSRFLRMYIENLAVTLAVLLPGVAVYGWFVKPSIAFYLLAVLCLLLAPIIPVAAASLVGALVVGISSRMKHKSLVEAALSIITVFVIMLGSSNISSMEGSITPDMLKELSATILSVLEKVYPPAVWLGRAMVTQNFVACLVCAAGFLAVLAAVMWLISINFDSICRRLYSTSAKHNYQMKKLEKSSVLSSLCKREFKRYFSSGVYVTNTIIGPAMGTVLSGALLFVGTDFITEVFPFEIDFYSLIPFVLAGVFCMMTTTATSVSMEGKNWWIVKSLPLTTKSILDAKILMNLILMLPFYLLSEIMLILALKPTILDTVWLLIIPASLMLFSCVYGITINLQFPVMNWESEVSVVKQSVSSLLGGMGGFLVAILCVAVILWVPSTYVHLTKLMICAVILGLTALLYYKNNHADLQAF